METFRTSLLRQIIQLDPGTNTATTATTAAAAATAAAVATDIICFNPKLALGVAPHAHTNPLQYYLIISCEGYW